MRLGFIGCGAITGAVVAGLRAAGLAHPILLSPRNAARAAALAARFPDVAVAGTNQAVLDGADVVVLAVRPPVAPEAVSPLCFRPDHRVISLMAGISRAGLAVLVAPAGHIVRAVPMPSAAALRSATAVFPPDPEAAGLFGPLGGAVEVETEDEFEALAAATATEAAHFAVSDAIAGWLVGQGVPEAKARDYVARMVWGLAAAAVEAPDESFSALATECATPGGMNEQVLRHLRASGVFERVGEGLDGILRRVRGA
jgi:pyrroline-5-carboxylate reductase